MQIIQKHNNYYEILFAFDMISPPSNIPMQCKKVYIKNLVCPLVSQKHNSDSIGKCQRHSAYQFQILQDFRQQNQLLTHMYSQLLDQPSLLDQEYQYLQKQNLVNNICLPPLSSNKEEETFTLVKYDAKFNFFCDPFYHRPRNLSKKDLQSQEIDDPGQKITFQEIECHFEKQPQTRQHINEPRRQNKRKQYPTKNFLPAFKPSFISYLGNNFEEEYFNSIPIISRINQKKNAITLRDYQDLFNFEEFRPILEIYFADKEIYRYLMMSRIDQKNKLIYLRKIHVFERAFKKRIFDKIN